MGKPPSSKPVKPVVLCVLDGWGFRAEPSDNALEIARLPNWRRLWQNRPKALIATSGEAVGLPPGQMGNSEVGHMNIGAGRIALPELARIDAALADGSFGTHRLLADLFAKVKEARGRLHVMGLLSPGGVHAMQEHILAMVRLAVQADIPVRVHAFLDGRDTPPTSAKGFVREFQASIAGLKDVRIATLAGRYYAMDRDSRWERTRLAYLAIVEDKTDDAPFPDPVAAIERAYARSETDEFLKPVVIGDYRGMADGDGLFMANFRSDRARQILTALLAPAFDRFPRRCVRFAAACGMIKYSEALSPYLQALFPPQALPKTLGELVSRAGRRQLRIAETEKYAHVTFFFNGGVEDPYPGEERILVPSPKVATYDQKPEMSAPEVTDRLLAAIRAKSYDLIVVNYANPDMVGHTGNLDAAVKAAECIDRCLGRIEAAVDAEGGVLLITADHGNLEQMRDPRTGEAHTQHTTNPVPAILCGPAAADYALDNGRLADIAPTLLPFLGITQPPEMVGRSLLRPRENAQAVRRARS
jgi:2,3-bisphosphoglycerate-independent phosphoglycerate mutase